MPMEVVRTLAERQAQTHAARQAPRCHYLKANGEACGAAASRGQELCYFHQNAQPGQKPERLPVLEDANAIQVALMIVMDGLYRYHIPCKTAALLLYGLQIAAANLRHLQLAPAPAPVETLLATSPGVASQPSDVVPADDRALSLRSRCEKSPVRSTDQARQRVDL